MPDDVGGGRVEEHGARGADSSALQNLDRQGGEGAARAQFVQLELERLMRIGRPHHDHGGRHDPATRGTPAGGDDGLPEHLAALDDGSPFVAPGDAEEGEPVLGGADIHDVDEMRGIAPGREPLHRHVLCGVPLGLVRDLNPDPVLIEGCVAGQLRERLRRAGRSRTTLDGSARDRCPRGGSRGRAARREPQRTGTIGLRHDPAVPPGARSVRVAIDLHARDERAQLIRRGGARRSPTRSRRNLGGGPCRRR